MLYAYCVPLRNTSKRLTCSIAYMTCNGPVPLRSIYPRLPGQRIGTNKELQWAYLDYHRHEMMAGPQTFIMSYVRDYGDASLRQRAYQ